MAVHLLSTYFQHLCRSFLRCIHEYMLSAGLLRIPLHHFRTPYRFRWSADSILMCAHERSFLSAYHRSRYIHAPVLPPAASAPAPGAASVFAPASVPVSALAPASVFAPASAFAPGSALAPASVFAPGAAPVPVSAFAPASVFAPASAFAPGAAPVPVSALAPASVFAPGAAFVAVLVPARIPLLFQPALPPIPAPILMLRACSYSAIFHKFVLSFFSFCTVLPLL